MAEAKPKGWWAATVCALAAGSGHGLIFWVAVLAGVLVPATPAINNNPFLTPMGTVYRFTACLLSPVLLVAFILLRDRFRGMRATVQMLVSLPILLAVLYSIVSYAVRAEVYARHTAAP